MTKSNPANPGATRQAKGAARLLLAVGVVLLPLMVTQAANAQTYKLLHSFADGADGAAPTGGLVRDDVGNLYGTTAVGGLFDCGTVYMVSSAGHETVLYSFLSGSVDGCQPYAGLVRDTSGNLYGTTYRGGTYGFGVVFKVDASVGETVLYNFTGGTDGGKPTGSLIRDAAGDLYGTTTTGGNTACSLYGPKGCGTVFELSQSGKEKVLYAFTGQSDGGYPTAALVQDSSGNLYGTTQFGGNMSCPSYYLGCGTVFALSRNGQESVLHAFAGESDGFWPLGTLIRDAAGNLYGTANSGGADSWGTLFEVTPGGTESVLYSFTGGADGATPEGALAEDSSGNLYGAASAGGVNAGGTLFRLLSGGALDVLYSFDAKREAKDGENPEGGLVLSPSGNLFGTVGDGGADGYGGVFEVVM